MKVLFLDVDGVLNNLDDFKTQQGNGTYVLCEKKIKLLHQIIDELGLTVVLSSTWRLHTDHMDYLYNQGAIQQRFMHKDWRTPAVFGCRPRGVEIQEWLEDHPEVTAYVIVDDDSDMLDEQMPRFVHTSFQDRPHKETCATVLFSHDPRATVCDCGATGGLNQHHIARIRELFR